MQEQSIGKKYKNKSGHGFVTLEVLIAFATLILCISAVIMLTFGNQSVAIDSEISNEAVSKAQALLEKARADSRNDFNLVNPTTTTEASGPLMFTKALDVIQTDMFTKKVTSTISWENSGRILSTIFTTILTDPEGAKNGNTCSSVLSGDWSKPKVESIIDFSNISGVPVGTYLITDLNAYKEKLYVTVGNTTENIDPTFFVFDVKDTGDPQLLGSVDNASTTIEGLNKVAVSDNYAYVANGYTGSSSNCEESNNCAQLQIIDIHDPLNPTVEKNMRIHQLTLSGKLAAGTDVFYSKNYVYVGLAKTSGGQEFNIIDVSIPLNPVLEGGYSIGGGINSTFIKDNYAYIASPNTEAELQILDISNPGIPKHAGGFSEGSGNGKSMQLVGDKIYFGRTTDGGKGEDFQILNNKNPNSTLKPLDGVNISSSVNGVIVRDYLAFLLTNKDLRIFNVSDPLDKELFYSLDLPGTYDSSKSEEPSLDCEGNRLFISSNNDEGQGNIYIIKPGTE